MLSYIWKHRILSDCHMETSQVSLTPNFTVKYLIACTFLILPNVVVNLRRNIGKTESLPLLIVRVRSLYVIVRRSLAVESKSYQDNGYIEGKIASSNNYWVFRKSNFLAYRDT